MTGVDFRLAREQLDELVAASQGAISLPVEPRISSTGDELVICVSLDCACTVTGPGGLALRKRERFTIVVPRGFPFDKPMVFVPHRRWADVPHVQWGSLLCLYAAPSIEWVPADGLFGLVERLSLWLEHAALGKLDPDDQPLHPPVAYVGIASGVVVVRADIDDLAPVPTITPRPLPGLATDAESHVVGVQKLVVGIAEVRSPGRYDVIEWVARDEWLRRYTEGKLTTSAGGKRLVGMLAILCDREFGFEYPSKAAELITALERMGTTRAELFRAIGLVAAVNDLLLSAKSGSNDSGGGDPAPPDLHLLVGTPSRRRDDKTLRQHLVCWRFDRLGRLIAENLIYAGSDTESLARVGALVNESLPRWIDAASTSWVRVLEDRAEITMRRDVSSPVAEVRGRRVMVLGCGALGGPIAEFCVRAGAARVEVIDNDIVTPGILVRQPYEDDDIGEHKATALAARLNPIPFS